MNTKIVILPMDGYMRTKDLLMAIKAILSEPGADDLISHVKINDAAHMGDMPAPKMISVIRKVAEDVGAKVKIFFDSKVGDVHGTLKNYTGHYNDQPDILTVSSKVGGKGFVQLRKGLPNTKLALFSVPTDWTIDECRKRHGKHPDVKILEDVRCIEEEYARERKSGDPKQAFDLIVCSPLELDFLVSILGHKYGFIVPGIRDEWMLKGQQARSAGAGTALKSGATYLVMGSQMTKGNSGKGISAEESRRRTAEEITKAGMAASIEMKERLINLVIERTFRFSNEPTFKLASGKMSSYYFNCKPTTLNAEGMYIIGHLVYDIIRRQEQWRPKGVGGLTLGADAISNAISYTSHLEKDPLESFVVRKGPKKHGTMLWIEGNVKEGDKVIITEDVITTGGSTIKAIDRARECGLEVMGVVVLIDRQEGGKEAIENLGVPVRTLLTREEIFESYEKSL